MINLSKTALILFSITFLGLTTFAQAQKVFNSKIKTSLNAYSFNAPLMSGEMNLDDLLEYCAAENFDAVDITAYYFPGYPEVPSDEYLYHIKQKAFLLGLDISGIGVRNDFTEPDPSKRKESVQLVKNWIIAGEKLGAPVIRLFAGNSDTPNFTRQQVQDYLVADMKECAQFGKTHGVVVAMQNHNDFVKTSSEVIEIMKAVDSDWFGLILDTGSYRSGDPYSQIDESIPYAVNWQIKEKLFVDGEEQDVDLPKLMKIIKDSDYRGYIPIETLGEGDPKIKVSRFLKMVKQYM